MYGQADVQPDRGPLGTVNPAVRDGTDSTARTMNFGRSFSSSGSVEFAGANSDPSEPEPIIGSEPAPSEPNPRAGSEPELGQPNPVVGSELEPNESNLVIRSINPVLNASVSNPLIGLETESYELSPGMEQGEPSDVEFLGVEPREPSDVHILEVASIGPNLGRAEHSQPNPVEAGAEPSQPKPGDGGAEPSQPNPGGCGAEPSQPNPGDCGAEPSQPNPVEGRAEHGEPNPGDSGAENSEPNLMKRVDDETEIKTEVREPEVGMELVSNLADLDEVMKEETIDTQGRRQCYISDVRKSIIAIVLI